MIYNRSNINHQRDPKPSSEPESKAQSGSGPPDPNAQPCLKKNRQSKIRRFSFLALVAPYEENLEKSGRRLLSHLSHLSNYTAIFLRASEPNQSAQISR